MNQGDTDWAPVIDLIERVTVEKDLLPSVVAGVSSMVREVSVLPPADIAGHTRALLAAATRAIAARRGPTEAELSFVAELAVTRARQGVPIEAVLSAIHVAERAIWSRAREVAAAEGIGAGLLLDARELYDDWVEAVRSRLIRAHREAQATGEPGPDERDAAILRRLLDGGSAAALAAAEAGLPTNTPLWVMATRPTSTVTTATRGPGVSALVDGLVIAVVVRAPASHDAGVPAGVAGPVEAENLAAARRLAVSALTAAEATGRTGIAHVADVAVLAAVAGRSDLASVLLERHRAAWRELGANAEPVARAVCAWLEARRDVTSAAGHLFVHPNTVRNRVQRFTDVTGIDPSDTFGAVNAWWLCRTWLAPG
ncbi:MULTISPECIES: helix-turn-helix domain-containing protein [unclassified Spirillospora]|uniref:helix-turn-helix domain-containing protein n=1 Tax=unclassified Spirillospora TaxID=2642701 RepID=UPI003722F6D8